MLLSGSCTRCSCPLTVDSVGGLCTACRAADETLRSPAPNAPAPGPNTVPLRVAGPETVSFGPDASGTQSLPPTRPGAPTTLAGRAPSPPAGYELVRRLGRGGMGDVYLARDVPADRLVALKFLLTPGNPTAAERFLVEVRALARLDHPHIVRVLAHDFYRADPFFAMEYAAGGSLSERVARDGPLPPDEAARVVASAARALHAAHEVGVLHRDLKPSNILLAADGSVRVSDFGLAKRTDRDDELTTGSGPLGTLAYMPPEQARRGPIDRRADVYGLGATLYHLLTDDPPFSGSEADVLTAVVRTPPPRPRSVRPDVPMGLEAIVVKCLEKDPADRYPTALALAEDLDRFLAGGATDAPHMTRSRRARRWAGRNRAGIAAAVVVAAVAVGLVSAGRLLAPVPKPGPDPLEVVRKELEAGRKVTLVGETGLPPVYDPVRSWKLMPSNLAASPATGDCAAFDAPRYTCLELLADPRLERYRVTAEIRQLQGLPHDPAGRTTMSFVGLYFGHAPQALGGARADAVWAVQFTDYQEQDEAGRPERADVDLCSWVFVQSPGGLPRSGGIQKRGIPFTPVARWPGEWRRVVLDVTPDGVVAKWWDGAANREVTVGAFSAAEIARQGEEMAVKIGRMEPGTAPAPIVWQPRSPFGVIAYKATVAFRNVTIEPLP